MSFSSRFRGPPTWGTLVLFSVICLFFLVIWRARQRRRWSTALGFLLFASVVACSGCGGGSPSSSPGSRNAGTPPCTCAVVVTGTTGNLSHTTNVSVTVQ